MFSIGKSNSSSQPIYFDVRIKSPYKNIVLIQGSPLESAPIPLHGHLVFSLPEHLTIKRISLKLTGNFKLEFLQVGQHKNSNLASIVKEEHKIFECVWNNLLVSSDGIITSGDASESEAIDTNSSFPVRPNVTHSLSTPVLTTKKKLKRSNTPTVLELPTNGVSGTPYDGITTQTGTSFHLPKGNYELPFKVMLPPTIPETVEGLQAGSVLYKFESQLERGGFKNPYTKYKYLRIFRTLTADNLAIQEEMYVGKSWTDRLQYEISIPSRAIPIGGITPITVRIYPFQKGYRLSKIGASLVQYYAFKDSHGQIYDDETTLFQQAMTKFSEVEGCDASDGNLLVDKISINSSIQLPDNLKKVTQDCDINGDLIRVRHKLRVNLVLKRKVPQGESGQLIEKNTEIKANIPVMLYISPHVPMNGRLVLLDNVGKVHFRSGELIPLFEAQRLGANTSSNSQSLNNLQRLRNGNFSVNYFPKEDLEAPPTYEKHVYDRLYDGSKKKNIAELLSGSQSLPNSTPNSAPNSAPNSEPSSPWAAPNSSNLDSYFDVPKSLSLENLNRVPSYEQTMDFDEDEVAPPLQDLAPAYEDATSNSGTASPQNLSRPTSPDLFMRRPEPLRNRPISAHGSLSHFIRAHTPEYLSSDHESRVSSVPAEARAGSPLKGSSSNSAIPSSSSSKLLGRLSSSNLQSLYGLKRHPDKHSSATNLKNKEK